MKIKLKLKYKQGHDTVEQELKASRGIYTYINPSREV